MKPVYLKKMTLVLFVITVGIISGCSSEEIETPSSAQVQAQRQVVANALQQYAHASERDRRISNVANAIEQVAGNPEAPFNPALPVGASKPHFHDVAASMATVLCTIKFTAVPSVELQADTTCNDTSAATLRRLTEFTSAYRAFIERDLRVYYHSDTEQLLAFELRGKTERIYIIANLSYDVLPIPFPHGFMTSTKVTLWETNQSSTRTFVTQWPLSIQPMSAVIIVV